MLDLHTARARLSRNRAAVSGQRGGADRHRQPAEVRSRPVQDRRRLGSLSRPDRRGAADQPAPRRNPRRPRSADPLHRLHALLSQRGRIVRAGCARADPPASVRQGRAGQVHDAGAVVRRARAADRQRRRSAEAARAAVSHDAAVHRRHGIRVGEDLRHRSVAAEPEDVSRDFVLQQHRGVSGAPREHQVPGVGQRQGGVRAHPERLRPGRRPNADCDPRELPAEGWLGHDSAALRPYMDGRAAIEPKVAVR